MPLSLALRLALSKAGTRPLACLHGVGQFVHPPPQRRFAWLAVPPCSNLPSSDPVFAFSAEVSLGSISGLLLVTDCEHEDRLLARHVAVERDVTSLPEPDHELPQLRLIVEWPPHVGRGLEQL